jgi:hypothetical protein
MVSIRPLRVEELADILAIQFDEEDLPKFNIDWRPAYAEEMIVSVNVPVSSPSSTGEATK